MFSFIKEPANTGIAADNDQLGHAPGNYPLIVVSLKVGCEQHQERNLKTLDVMIPEKKKTHFNVVLEFQLKLR